MKLKLLQYTTGYCYCLTLSCPVTVSPNVHTKFLLYYAKNIDCERTECMKFGNCPRAMDSVMVVFCWLLMLALVCMLWSVLVDRSTLNRSPSLDLAWPESPHQPSTTAGQPGPLSPASCKFLSLSAADIQARRQVAVKQAWHLYNDYSSRVVGVTENRVITSDRQAKRQVLCCPYWHLIFVDFTQLNLKCWSIFFPSLSAFWSLYFAVQFSLLISCRFLLLLYFVRCQLVVRSPSLEVVRELEDVADLSLVLLMCCCCGATATHQQSLLLTTVSASDIVWLMFFSLLIVVLRYYDEIWGPELFAENENYQKNKKKMVRCSSRKVVHFAVLWAGKDYTGSPVAQRKQG